MSSLALMRWLESAPERYDAGMRALTLGRVTAVHDAVARAAAPAPGARVLEIGCGTGAVTERLVVRGARVTALEPNPRLLEVARARAARHTGAAVAWLERSAAELDALPAAAFDAVVICLALSELSADERRFALREAAQRLAPGGRLVVADEVRPEAAVPRALFAVLRLPQAALGWLLAGSVSRPLSHLAEELESARYRVQGRRSWLLGSLVLVIAEAAPRARAGEPG